MSANCARLAGRRPALLISDAAAVYAIAAGEDESDGLGIDAVLLYEDTSGEGLDCVVIEYRHGGLDDDGAGIEIFVDEVDGAAGDLHAVGQRLVLRVESRERGQERRVDVQN